MDEKKATFPHLSLREQLWLPTTPSCWFLLVPNPQLMHVSGWTRNDGLQIYTQIAAWICYNHTGGLIAILINILSEQNQRAALTPELCSHFPGRVGASLWGQDQSLLPPPVCSFSSEGDEPHARSKSRSSFFPATANRNSGLCASNAHPSLEGMALLVKLGLGPPLSPFFL